MPFELEFDLPIALTRAEGHTLAQPLGFPEIAIMAARSSDAVEQCSNRIARLVREFATRELVNGLVRGVPSVRQCRHTHKPLTKSIVWREPIEITWDLIHWSVETSLEVVLVPALQLRVVASASTDLDKLVREQISTAISRQDRWSLQHMVNLSRSLEPEILTVPLSVSLRTPAEIAAKQSRNNRSQTTTLRKVANRLNPKRLKNITGRENEIKRLDELLGRPPASMSLTDPIVKRASVQHRKSVRRSVLLVGPSGVGKTALFHAWLIQQHRPVDSSGQSKIAAYATDGSRLISGQSGFGGWQEQCLAMTKELQHIDAIVHLGNAAELCESGKNWGSGGVGALLAPSIAEGKVQAVIECTEQQWSRLQRVEPRLMNALTVLKVNEPNEETSRRILLDAAVAWKPVDVSEDLKQRSREKKRRRAREQGRTVRGTKQTSIPKKTIIPEVQPEALEWIDRLHRRFPTAAAFPGRVLNFFDSVMAEMVADVDRKSRKHTESSTGEVVSLLDTERVIQAFGRQTGLPRFLIDPNVMPDLNAIADDFNGKVLGQNSVMEAIVDLIAVMSTDLSRGDRPLASLMMIGPTGVGKTETAKALARWIYSDVSRLVRIDMSEYSDPIAAMRLVGTAAEPDGVLTSAVQAQPFSLILLDEFEKADSSVFDLLLQVLGEGRLTDRRGRTADFRNSIIMMTSNLGVDDYHATPMGLAAGDDRDGETKQSTKLAMENHFRRRIREFLRPEMANRIDRILTFDPLDQATIHRLADREVARLRQREGMAGHDGQWNVAPAVVAKIARQGYQPQYGARPLLRQVERELLAPLNQVIPRLRRYRIDIDLYESNDRIGAKTTVIGPSNQRESDSGRTTMVVKNGPGEITDRERILRVSDLRRRSQSLIACESMQRAQTRWTMMNRRFKRDLARTKDQSQRERLFYDNDSQIRERLRQLISDSRRLVHRIQSFEARVVVDYLAGATIDAIDIETQTNDYFESLFLLLCELVEPNKIKRDRVTLVISGPNLSIADPLLTAYQRWATDHDVNLQVHAILKPKQKHRAKPIIDTEGWNTEPAFRLGVAPPVDKTLSDDGGDNNDSGELGSGDVVDDFVQTVNKLRNEIDRASWRTSSSNKQQGNGKPAAGKREDEPTLAAYRLANHRCLTRPPERTLAIMMTFRGEDVAGLIGDEAGLHTFRFSQGKQDDHGTILVEAIDELPINYAVPSWLATSDFQVDGYPRRRYDLLDKFVHDLSPSHIRFPRFLESADAIRKLDREGRWLADLIQWRREAIVWGKLEHDWPDEDSDLAIPF